MTFLFEQHHPSVLGTKLNGQFVALSDIRCLAASIIAIQPPRVVTKFSLFVNDTETQHAIYLFPASQFGKLKAADGILLNKDDVFDWRVTQGPSEDSDAAIEAAITMTALENSLSGSTLPEVDLYVMWQNGQENFRIFDFSSVTHTFSESTPGISTGRASITTDSLNSVTIQIQGSTVFNVSSGGVMTVMGFYEHPFGVTTPKDPALIFYSGKQWVCRLNPVGLECNGMQEKEAITESSDVFTLYAGGAPGALLSPASVHAKGFLSF